MNRDQIEAHLTLHGWEPQTDYDYYHLVHNDRDLCAYVRRQEFGATDWAATSSAYLSGPINYGGTWQIIPDDAFARLYNRLITEGWI